MKRRGWVVLVLALGTGACAMALQGCDDPKKGDKGAETGAARGDSGAQGDGKGKDGKGTKAAPRFEDVTLDGKTYKLELALDDATRFHGLSDRESIPADGGMLFVFKQAQALSFVMRDCPVDIDIIYLDGAGRVVNKYKMKAEEARGEGEKLEAGQATNQKYEDRLKKYPSGYDAQFVIELKGGTLDSLNIKNGDKVKLDVARLKQMAK